MTHGDSEGLLFLLHPFTNNELFFLHTFSCSCKIRLSIPGLDLKCRYPLFENKMSIRMFQKMN